MSSPEDPHILTPGGPSNLTEDDDASVNAWAEFLQEYARGDGPANPVRPPLTASLFRRLETVTESDKTVNFDDAPLYSSTTVTPELARVIRDFYCDNAYLPPPRAPWEDSRERCIQEYDLYSETQKEQIQSMTDLTSDYFPDTLITFSLFQDRVQTHYALSGPPEIIRDFKLHVGLRIPAEDSLCGHAVLLDRAMLFVPDLQADWRYQRNPFGLAGFKSYIGVPIALELDPLREDVQHWHQIGPRRGRIAIGTLNICFTRERMQTLSTKQKRVVGRVASMLETQLRATWEGDRRRRDARARTEISNYIEETMIGQAARTPGGRRSKLDREVDDDSRRELHVFNLIQSLSKKVNLIISEADGVDVFDVRAFSSVSAGAQYFDSKTYPLRCLASSNSRKRIQLTPSAVISFFETEDHVFGDDNHSGLEPCLPVDTKRHLALTLADGDRPQYLIVVTSSSLAYEFSVADVNFVRNLGALLVAKLTQTRYMREDAAKTSFLSAISHELRTPMHAVTTSHALMRDAITLLADTIPDTRMDELDALLSLSESSSRTLTNILNDVLDYGKGTAGDSAENRNQLVPDLVRTVIQTVKVAESQYVSESYDVTISVEHDVRDWAVHLDEARFQRVLINGLTNAMKFCHSGSITVRLQTQSDKLVVQIVDTGVGFDESEMPLVFQAFKKLDINSPGAGLGLNITKAMLEKAGGSLTLRSTKGKGTTFEATLPVTWAKPTPPNDTPRTTRRQQIRPDDGECLSSAPVRKKKTSVDVDKAVEKLGKSPDAAPAPAEEQVANKSVTQELLRVLIVDDNHICLALLKRSLRKGPVAIDLREANGGSQALDVFRQFHPDLVLTDVCMPGIDGIAAAEMMREHEVQEKLPRSAIYAVTALGDTDSRSKSKGLNGSADLDGWLVKGQDLAHVARDIANRLSASDRRGSPRTGSAAMMSTQTA